MCFRYVVLCALLAAANCGGLVSPVAYTQFHNVAVAHPSEEAHHRVPVHFSKEEEVPSGFVLKEGSHVNHNIYVPTFARTVHFTSPAHSGQVYSGYSHVPYEVPSYGRRLSSNEESTSFSSGNSGHVSQEASTTELSTTEIETTEAQTTEETTPAPRSVEKEPQPTQTAYRHESSTSAGYRYDTPSVSSYKFSSVNPTFLKQHNTASVPSVIKYAVQAPTFVKYAAQTHYAAPQQTVVHYTAPSQTVYHHAGTSKAVQVKNAAPESTVYTSFGEHPPAVHGYYGSPASHTSYEVPQPALIKLATPAQAHVSYVASVPSHTQVSYVAPAPTQAHISYVAPAPAVYTKYGPTEQANAGHTVQVPTAYIKYGSPAPSSTYTTLDASEHTHAPASTKLYKYDGPAYNTPTESSTESHSSPINENNDSVEVKSEESTQAPSQASRAYLPPPAQNYKAPVLVYNHQEAARSHSNEHNNLWSADGAASHVSFKGFGTSFAY